MKILCIFLIFVFTVSCGPAVNKPGFMKKAREIEERKRECFLVRGSCKTSCNSWEYKYNFCDIEPCCVVREYIKPTIKRTTTGTAHKRADFNYTT
ncbi:beta-defensin 113 [Talpa occidentalis]|uniref:beta-defensin 113 n=1 Tax=Talpa occidentalis TaxID=50954 RepID=UPI00188F099B|nr:beta-defensin 113 [Talpa occidentalis]